MNTTWVCDLCIFIAREGGGGAYAKDKNTYVAKSVCVHVFKYTFKVGCSCTIA